MYRSAGLKEVNQRNEKRPTKNTDLYLQILFFQQIILYIHNSSQAWQNLSS